MNKFSVSKGRTGRARGLTEKFIGCSGSLFPYHIDAEAVAFTAMRRGTEGCRTSVWAQRSISFRPRTKALCVGHSPSDPDLCLLCLPLLFFSLCFSVSLLLLAEGLNSSPGALCCALSYCEVFAQAAAFARPHRPGRPLSPHSARGPGTAVSFLFSPSAQGESFTPEAPTSGRKLVTYKLLNEELLNK